ncbi:MAG: peptidase, partial [Halanaerobiaceae bacterium]|nr:peptidase [Halanaerobiaceae bacterium]
MKKRVLILYKRILLFSLMIISGGVLASYAGNGSNILTIEAEDGTINGLRIVNDDSASGGAYVDGFDSDGKNLVLTAELPADAVYQVLVRYKTYSGDKTNYIYLNGTKVADFVFKDTAEWKETIIGQFKLKKGKNTLKIASFWGWIGVDYVQFVGGTDAPVKRVDLSAEDGNTIGLDSSLILNARADTAAEYCFFVREKGGQWEKLGDYSENSGCIWLPPSIGEFEFMVWAR